MKIFYFKDPAGNFGDDLNDWIWETLAPGLWDARSPVHFSGIGTIIGPTMPSAPAWVVFSSGAGYGPPPEGFGGAGWELSCVRGPLTAKVLGLDEKLVVSDGAMLLSQVPGLESLPESEREGVVFMPHHHALYTGAWEEVCERAGITFLDPRADSRTTLQRIRAAHHHRAHAMHAAITADALRVPWVPVTTSREISTFKWLDWTLSLGLPYEPLPLPQSTTAEALRSATLPLYAYDFALDDHSLEGVLGHYRRDRARKAARSWPMRRNLGHGLDQRGLLPMVNSGALAPLRRPLDERRLDRAAHALQAAARAKPILSSDAAWERAVGELSLRLEAVVRARSLAA
jgi:succinoglycan biosynthesis protein ExoV